MALTLGVTTVLRRLGREYPFIFAQKEKIQRFLNITRHNSALADALCRVYDRATSLKERQSMKDSLERIRVQFPGVPPNDTQLLLKYALEGVAYNLIKTTTREKRARRGEASIETGLLDKARDPERPKKQLEDDYSQRRNNDEHYTEMPRRHIEGEEEMLTTIDIAVEDGLDELDIGLLITSEDSAFPESCLSDFCFTSSEEEQDYARDEDD
ncbi:hypothetical protein EDD21DRAFT_61018 [Dissophora ornata]|nr:hypothetical protein EDD21DRAFT_61018 [Dissophora ornata]